MQPLFGLKLGIGEAEQARRAAILWNNHKYDFLELYIHSYAKPEDAALWFWYEGFLVLHGPHSGSGFNFASHDKAEANMRAVELVDAIRRRLLPDIVIFHPGLDGEMSEALRQIGLVRKNFPDLHEIMLLENKPAIGLDGEICLGASPEEIKMMLGETGCGFCLDVRHAFAYAAANNLSGIEVLKEMVQLRPRLWHVADGLVDSPLDSHLHIGEGDMPLRDISLFWSLNTLVTIECQKNPNENLVDFLKDITLLKDFFSYSACED